MRKKLSILSLILFFTFTAAHAKDIYPGDNVTLQLNSGKQVTAELIEQASDYIKLSLEGMTITFYHDEIESINGESLLKNPSIISEDVDLDSAEDIEEELPEKKLPEQQQKEIRYTPYVDKKETIKQKLSQPKKQPVRKNNLWENSSSESEAIAITNSTYGPRDENFDHQFDDIPNKSTSSYKKTSYKIDDVSHPLNPRNPYTGFFITYFFLIGLGLLSHFVSIFAFWIIAKKVGTERPPWFAAVPLGNFVIMVDIARRPLWWAILLFIPAINVIVYFIICLDIAKTCKKDLFWGALLFLPIITVIPLIYLAWTTEDTSKKVSESEL